MNAAAMAVPGDVRLMNLISGVIAAGVGVVLVASAVQWAARHPAFEIREIEIKGEVERSNVATIRANAGPGLAGNFFSLDLEAARAAFRSVPWVREAHVRRIWPNTLEVQLEEHHPAAIWESPEGDRLVNTHGEVFQANPGEVEDAAMPVLRGPEGSSASMLAAWQRLLPLFEPVGLKLESLELGGRGSWTARLADGASVELGRGDADVLAERVERFVRTLPEVSRRYEGRALLYADLRHADAYALRLQGIQTTTTPARLPASAGNRGRDNR